LPPAAVLGSFPLRHVTPRPHRLLVALFLPTLTILLTTSCRQRIPAITEPFTDGFDGAEVGPAWLNTGGNYRIINGRLNIAGAENHPLWLRKTLPSDVVVDIDVMSTSPDGDVKVELDGDGESFDRDGNRYEATGYMFVFGGWQNSLSIIGRMGEHDDAVKARRALPKVEPNRVYHWTITKHGRNIEWKMDGQPFLAFDDPTPLGGSGHQFFGINNWRTDDHFDNLRIQPYAAPSAAASSNRTP
jgi:hypothetical protein